MCVCVRVKDGGACPLRDVEERVRGVGRQKEEGSFDVALGPTWRFCQRDATSVTWRGGRGGGAALFYRQMDAHAHRRTDHFKENTHMLTSAEHFSPLFQTIYNPLPS